ncbi:chitinase N-terminal domain-containing protein [Paenibacillus sedimenti]|uniref:Chitinase A N-terminal domain-containing protein n=1 Tax=Paenibacillus sedimenti TaxID=2770274 RepID=A0A926KY52_9BACL|nr:chitinase N-terminal domain-containing protein [Paenibacillus sedimenti]MBD0384398.1 hypothetical protein [Paenibacillus sedimenti]
MSSDNLEGNGNFKVAMYMWWGTNGTTYRLYENGVLIDTQNLSDRTPSAQEAVSTIANKAKGNYEYRAELVNFAGVVSSDSIMIQVTK